MNKSEAIVRIGLIKKWVEGGVALQRCEGGICHELDNFKHVKYIPSYMLVDDIRIKPSTLWCRVPPNNTSPTNDVGDCYMECYRSKNDALGGKLKACKVIKYQEIVEGLDE